MSSSSPDSDGTEPPVIPAAPGMCIHHPNLRAAFVCSTCKQLICELCAFTRTDGSRICSQCASSAGSRAAESGPRLAIEAYAPPSRVHALKCLQHPNVPAVQVCKACSGPMCATCDFLLPGDIHLCPRCVAAPPKRMSRQRRGLVIAAYVFAIWGTFALAIVFSGALRSLTQSREDSEAFDMLFGLLLIVPAIVGGGIGISCFDPRLRNPPSVWAAAIWNGLILLIYVGLIIVGHLSH
jgi:hypothetical protein